MEDENKSGLEISLGDLVSLFPLCCTFGVPELFFWGIRRLAGPQVPDRQVFCTYGSFAPHTPYMHTIIHIHCHYKQRDMKRRHRQSVVPAPGTAAEQPTLDAVDDDDGTPSSAK
jgi:hypothetical protein